MEVLAIHVPFPRLVAFWPIRIAGGLQVEGLACYRNPLSRAFHKTWPSPKSCRLYPAVLPFVAWGELIFDG